MRVPGGRQSNASRAACTTSKGNAKMSVAPASACADQARQVRIGTFGSPELLAQTTLR